MTNPRWLTLAREGRLYPSVILHGGSEAGRRDAALDLSRALLCERPAGERPCGTCRHCRRIGWAANEPERFHPDFAVLERDLKTSTSTEATRALLRTAQLSPYEARGQVFVIADAASLTGEAADALLKAIEEPHLASPRHFFLLTPSRFDLPATLRSRSLALFLSDAEPPEEKQLAARARAFARAVDRHQRDGGGLWLLEAAARLGTSYHELENDAESVGPPRMVPKDDMKLRFEDPRAERPWSEAAAAVRTAALENDWPAALRRALLALAEELLTASPWRLRGIPAERLLEGLVSRHLAPFGGRAAS